MTVNYPNHVINNSLPFGKKLVWGYTHYYMKHIEGIGVALFLMGAFSFGVTLLSKETTLLATTPSIPVVASVKNIVSGPVQIENDEAVSQQVALVITAATVAQKNTSTPLFRSSCLKGSGDPDASMMAISPTVGINVSYVPDDLVSIPKSYTKDSSFCLTQATKDAVVTLIDAAHTEGVSIKISSAFRSYGTQAYLYRMHFDILKLTRKTVALAGHSEHQLGTAVDLSGASIGYKSAAASFGTTPEYAWLIAHASEYGFVQSYPKGTESITGYATEPWHFRYVGKEIAQAIAQEGVTLYEYLNKMTGEAVSI